ncbi:MAG: DUF1501 domain-containing protein, partial [Gemmataceae bacterium]
KETVMLHAAKLLDRCTRRDMLKLASFGALGTTVTGWMDIVSQTALAADAQKQRKIPKNMIVLFMSGGPAHTFTFDLKKDGDRGCPYTPIATSTPGIQISEYLPLVARQMHHVAVVRGMSTGIADHGPAHYLMRTGFRQMAGIQHPHFASMAASKLIRDDNGMPSFVLLKPGSGSTLGCSNGFVDPSTRPLHLRDVSQGIANLNPKDGVAAVQKRHGLLQDLDNGFLDEYQADAIKAKLDGYKKAVQLMDMEKARAAFQIDKEPQAIRDLYGDTVFGKQCLGARRLIENGVRFVEVMHPKYWDTHGGAVKGQQKLTEELDRPMAALIEDLAQRGLLEDTLVVWMGEFGRDLSGNDHYAKAWTTCFAGGGVRGGQIIGRTDKKGMTVEERPVSVADFVASIYKGLGVDPLKKTWVRGRPIGLVDSNEPKPLDELYS